MIRTLWRAGAVMLLALPLLLTAGPALAHVTVRVDNPAPGAFATYQVRVPNERDDANTTAVEVRLPEGLEVSSYRPLPGWQITLDDEAGVMTVSGGAIEPGQYQVFEFVARNPEEPVELTFPALQTYDSGEVVEWTGPEDADTPASIVAIAAAEPEPEEGATAAPATPEPTEAEATAERVTAGPVSVAGLAVAVLALVVGMLALARAGRVSRQDGLSG